MSAICDAGYAPLREGKVPYEDSDVDALRSMSERKPPGAAAVTGVAAEGPSISSEMIRLSMVEEREANGLVVDVESLVSDGNDA